MHPVNFKPIKPIAWYYQNSINKIPSVRPTAATGTEYSYWGKGVLELQDKKEAFESNQTGR